MFLGAHAHYYLEGRIPEKINDHSRSFEIEDLARERKCWIADFAVNIFANAVWDAAQFGFGVFVWESYRAWTEGRLFEPPPFERREPLLSIPGGTNEQIFDPQTWDIQQRRRLNQRISDAMPLLTAPNGTSSSQLEIIMDGQLLDRIDDRLKTDELITDALIAMGARRKTLPRGSAH